MPEIFNNFGFEFFDYSDLSSLGLDDIYMLDGMHPSEVVMSKILINISNNKQNEKSNYYELSPNLLNKINNNKYNQLQVFW